MERVTYRRDQEPIINYKSGTMAVPAVPGAGKTFIISNLVCKIIEENFKKSGKVLVVTYMNSAVNNFKQRINKVLESKGITSKNDYEVMTIHSLALRILREKSHVVGINEEFRIIDDVNKFYHLSGCISLWRNSGGDDIFKSLLNDKGLENYDKSFKNKEKYWNDLYNTIDTLIGELKLNDITPDDLLKHKYENKILNIIEPVYRLYTERLNKYGFIDYNDILIKACKLLKSDDKLREKLQKRYFFIFEDECQDSNLIQGEILSMISQKSGNLVKVGDVNQSITGTFTSSSPKFFKEFCRNADEVYPMDMAGRSSKDIINLANYLVENTRNNHLVDKCRIALVDQIIKPHEKGFPVQNPETNKYGINTYVFSSENEEYDKATNIAKLFKEKYPNKSCAILVMYNSAIEDICMRLDKMNIKYEELSNNHKESAKIAKVLGHILYFLSDSGNKIKFITMVREVLESDFFKKSGEFNEVLKADENKRREEIEKLVDAISDFNIEDLIYPVPGNLKLNTEQKIVDEFIYIVEFIRKAYEIPIIDLSSFILNIGTLLPLSIKEKSVIHAISQYAYMKSKDINEFNISKMAEELIENENSMIKHMSSIIYELEGFEPSQEKVTVTNYHKSKGLEWDCVIMLNNNSYNYPYSLNDKFREDWYLKDQYKNLIILGKAEIQKILGEDLCVNPIEEARVEIINEKIRLLYVGITRAKETLMLMCNESNLGKWNESKPSRYFLDIDKFVKEERAKC